MDWMDVRRRAGEYGSLISFTQLDGLGFEHVADQPDTRER